MNSVRVLRLVAVVLLIALILVGVFALTQFQAASTAQAGLDCARPWLDKAVKLHDLHLSDPRTTTDESQMELMDQIMKANECVTGEAMPMR